MGELPDDPEQLKAYINHLQHELQRKDQDLIEAEKELLQLKQEINQNQVNNTKHLADRIKEIGEKARELDDKLSDPSTTPEERERILDELDQWRQYEEDRQDD